jgi:hypothetical protein
MSRTTTLAANAFAVACMLAVGLGCAETSGEERVRVVKGNEAPPPIGGISPEKESEIQLLLQQRNPSTLRCYQEVLDEKHDRAFKGSVIVVLTLDPAGDKMSKASNVKVIGGTLNNQEVQGCLVEKLKEFEYPEIAHSGSMQYTYNFEPAY